MVRHAADALNPGASDSDGYYPGASGHAHPGPSSGAILWVAGRVARSMTAGTIVALLPDGGWKYLSTGTYSRPLDDIDELEGGVAWW